MPVGSLLNASVGAYRLVDFLGAGGMGEVYRAVHVSLGRVVAVKVLTPTPGAEAQLMERFRNEARIHATLHHPHIATLYDFSDIDGRPCIIMEYVDGETLDARIRARGALPPAEALGILERVVDAVGYLHSRGVIHRDIKTNNVKLSAGGVVKLLDFGIARTAGGPKLTQTGAVIGTLHYLSPEQLAATPADERSDIWALGIVLYEMLTGRLPFDGSMLQLTENILNATYTAPSALRPGLPRTLDAIVSRCLRKRADERYQSAEALLTDIRLQLSAGAGTRPAPVPSKAPRRTGDFAPVGKNHAPLALSIGAVALSLGFLAWSLASDGPSTDPLVTPAQGVRPSGTAAQPAAAAGASRTIEIDRVAGKARVYRGDSLLGETPYRLEAALGEHVELVLRQDGCEDHAVDFWVTEGMQMLSYVMTCRESGHIPRPSGSPVVPLAFALASWGLPFRRKREALHPAVPETGIRPAAPAALPNGAMAPDSDPVGDAMAGPSLEARLDIGIATDPGCVREMNEDTIRCVRPADAEDLAKRGVLAVVADGMGGHSAGEVASRLAVDALVRLYADENHEPSAALALAIRRANRAIFQLAHERHEYRGMGTTCTALVLRGGWAYCAHVGDSRLYMLRDGELFLMTEDHSAVMDMVRRGLITRDEASRHPEKNVIVRALGGRSEVEVTEWPKPLALRDRDRFVLCSDGLYDVVTDEELREVVAAHAPQAACDQLVSLARSRGGPDNISVGVIAVGGSASTAPPGTTRVVEAMP